MANAEHPTPPEAKEISVVRTAAVAETPNKRSMEDTHYIEMNFGGEKGAVFAGVYDGHGGREAADSAKAVLHNRLMVAITEGLSQEDALRRAYLETSDVIKSNLSETVGCTAATVLIEGNTLYFANAGDARIVMSTETGFVRLTHDHKVEEPQEEARIKAAGGAVANGYVWVGKNGLAVARALGDKSHEGLVIPDPDVGRHELEESNTDLIIACDGLFDVMSDDEAIKIAKQYEDATKAAEALKEEAIKRGTGDNVSVVVVKLNPEVFKVEEEEKAAAPAPQPTPTPTPPPTAAPPPRPAAPRVEPAPAQVEPLRPAARVAAPEAAAREPLSAEEQLLAAAMLREYQAKFVSEAEVFYGEVGAKIRMPNFAEKQTFTQVFEKEIHDQMVENAREIAMGRKTAEEIAAAMTKEDLFFTHFSDAEHIQTKEDLAGLGHTLTLLLEKKLAAYYGAREFDFQANFQGESQKERDIAFVRFLNTERGLQTDPALHDELEKLFWMRLSIDGRLRGETHEEIVARKRELEFLAIKDQMGRIESWWKGRKIEDTGEYESFVAAFTNVEANRYLDGILKRRMDEMGIAAAERPEAPPTAEEAEIPEEMIPIAEIANLLVDEKGMTLLAKALEQIIRTKKELGDKDTLAQMSKDLGLKLSEKFIDKTAGSVRKARQVSVEQDIQSWIFAFLAALIYAITHRER